MVAHVIPLLDCQRHLFANCPCKPLVDTEAPIWIHNSFDGREFFEGEDGLKDKPWFVIGSRPLSRWQRIRRKLTKLVALPRLDRLRRL